MTWTIVLPGALVPAPWAPDVLAQARAPRLAQRLRRAQVSGDEQRPAGRELPHVGALWRAFGGTGDPVTAPYAWQACTGQAPDPGLALWRCDPVHFQFARDDLLVAPLAAHEALAADEADSLGALAETAALEHGARLLRPAPVYWWLAADAPWSLETRSLDAAHGASVRALWPHGPDAARWRRLLTDVQMRWHEHPVNAAREARGLPAVNALWLHGGGAWRPLSQRPFDALLGTDLALRGWMLAAGSAPAALHGADARPAAVRALVVLRDLQAAQQLGAWGVWLDRLAALDAALDDLLAHALAQAGAVELWLCGTGRIRRLTLHRGDGWRLWRSRTLAELLRDDDPALEAA